MTVVSVEDPAIFGHDARVTLTGGGLGSVLLTVLQSDIVDGRLNAETARLFDRSAVPPGAPMTNRR